MRRRGQEYERQTMQVDQKKIASRVGKMKKTLANLFELVYNIFYSNFVLKDAALLAAKR